MIFDTLKACSASTGVPVAKLKIARDKLGAQGFNHARVNWETFEAWVTVGTNKASLDELYSSTYASTQGDNRTTEEIKRSILSKDDVLRDLEIKKKSGDYLDPEDVGKFLLQLRLSFEGTINGWVGELPVKMVGKTQGEIESILNNEKNILLTNFSVQIKEKMKENDTGSS